jgi:acetyl-CoA carboxylase biotin carboxyl carrier protein
MDLKLIQEVIRMLEQSSISTLEVQEGDLRIRVCKESENLLPSTTVIPAAKNDSGKPSEDEAVIPPSEILYEINAPMLGVFYEAASPESLPFVKVGDRIKKGDVLCIIEAMKLMNEITADREGEIVEIPLENGQIVEYGQTLYKIR